MTARSAFIDPAVQAYLAEVKAPEHPLLARLRSETAAMPDSQMQIGADQGVFMQLLAHLIGAKRYLEIGVFTGYSSLAMALALPEDGRIVACDVSEEYTAIARRYWREAGVAEKIDLRLAPALETIADLERNGDAFDLAFIDADKPNVDAYYEAAVRLVRQNGLIVVDNVLWDGQVADPSVDDSSTSALRALNRKAVADARVETALVAVGDGLLLARKR